VPAFWPESSGGDQKHDFAEVGPRFHRYLRTITFRLLFASSREFPDMTPKASPVELKRVLSLGDLVLFGITFVGPTAPFPVFAIVSSISADTWRSPT